MNALSRVESRITETVQNWPDGLYRLMWMGSWFGDPIMVLSIAFSSFAVSLYWDDKLTAQALIWAVFAFCLSGLMKVALMKPRPANRFTTSMWIGGYSFPSGHAFGSLVIYGLLAYLAYTHVQYPAGMITCAIISVVILTIGLSRVYLGAHYPRDVLGGWILGGISLLLIIRAVLS